MTARGEGSYIGLTVHSKIQPTPYDDSKYKSHPHIRFFHIGGFVGSYAHVISEKNIVSIEHIQKMFLGVSNFPSIVFYVISTNSHTIGGWQHG